MYWTGAFVVYNAPLALQCVLAFFVRDGIHSDADYNSSRVGVGVVVVVVVAIFTMG